MSKCPVCRHMTFRIYEGFYEDDGEQTSPDQGECSHCGFFWEEHIKHSLREQAKKFILNEAR